MTFPDRPGLVLLHGGAATGRQWDLVLKRLQTPALAPNVPGRLDRPADLATLTLDDAVASLAADVDAAAMTSLVLVAHSSGGLLVPGLVGTLGPRVRGLVWIAASIPPDGGNGYDCMKPRHRDGLIAGRAGAAREGRALLTPPAPSPGQAANAYGGDPLTDEQAEFAASPLRWVPDTTNLYEPALRTSQLARLPRVYLRTLRDRAVPLALQEEMLARLPGTPSIPLDTGHAPMITMPAVLAALLDGFAADLGRQA